MRRRFYLLVLFAALLALPTAAQQRAAGPTLTVNLDGATFPISPHIYGMNHASEALANALDLPVRRWGGNDTTRFNWQLNVKNSGSDYFFESYNFPDNGSLPNGSQPDLYVQQDRRTGTESLLTVSMIGWTASDRQKRCGFRVSKYGAQQAVGDYHPDCGNGILTNGQKITWNDPTDTSKAVDQQFAYDFVTFMKNKYGTAANGGVRFYNLDNEPGLWNETHRDVHPEGLSYDKQRDLTYLYGRAVKDADPTAMTLGPAEWGWTGYWFSGKDREAGGEWWLNPVDRNAHGGVPLVVWYLREMQRYENENGIRILDYLDLHYYPEASAEGGRISLNTAGGAERQALRLRATRSLWDPTYADESWIATTEGGPAVRLIPRMREWVDQNYPGTKLAITEYNFGGLEHINGALTQADILGIFGREGLDLATLWAPPGINQPVTFAFRMYRNYDGAKGKFGNVGVPAASTDQGKLSVYAARRTSDGALTIMVINKTKDTLTSSVNLTGAQGGTAQVYRYSAANLNAITRETDVNAAASGFSADFPAESITLFVLPQSTPDPGATQLLQNAGFETAGSAAKHAANWTGKGLNRDRRKCNTASKTFAHSGTCAFMFTANAPSKLDQTVTSASMNSGTLVLSGRVQGKNLTGGASIMVKVKYTDGTTGKRKQPIAKGTYAYQTISTTSLALTGSVEKATARVMVKRGGGKFMIDDMTLTWTPASSLSELSGF